MATAELWEYFNDFVQFKKGSRELSGPNDTDTLCLFSPALLDVLTKNGHSAGNGAHCRRPASSPNGDSPRPQSESQEAAGGDTAKAFRKEQAEGVQK